MNFSDTLYESDGVVFVHFSLMAGWLRFVFTLQELITAVY